LDGLISGGCVITSFLENLFKNNWLIYFTYEPWSKFSVLFQCHGSNECSVQKFSSWPPNFTNCVRFISNIPRNILSD
jgi:hypothetical protein